ncbi:MAG: hypothetical protein RL265_490 [Bacteroidota bacterium]|jgi:hypothetical protein
MKKIVIFMAIAVVAFASCEKDKKNDIPLPPVPNEEELITTFKVEFTDVNGILPTVSALFVDVDGPGGNNPTAFDTIRLRANATYNAVITLLNESVSPADDITVEVQEEGIDHLFCFDISSGLNLTINKIDLDANNLAIGILSEWVTGSISTGTTTIRLKHQPGIKTGACELGDTDIELNFSTELN